MKALIRRKGETILETSPVKDIDWKTGAPLTNKEWYGGPYTLIDVEPEKLQKLLDLEVA